MSKFKRIKCRSGLTGEQYHLQSPYADFEEFEYYDGIYNLSSRLGFNTAREAWDANPLVEHSVEPSDFRISLPPVDKIIEGLDDFTKGYIEAALWASPAAEDSEDETLDKYSCSDIDPESILEMEKECKEFQEENKEALEVYYAKMKDDEYRDAKWTSEEYAGHDFFLTRNGHGAGYWDRGFEECGDKLSEACGNHECFLYVGDDGKVYYSAP